MNMLFGVFFAILFVHIGAFTVKDVDPLDTSNLQQQDRYLG